MHTVTRTISLHASHLWVVEYWGNNRACMSLYVRYFIQVDILICSPAWISYPMRARSHTPTHSSPSAGWEEEGRNSDHGPVGQVDEHDIEADRDAFLGKEERKRLDNMPPEKAKQEMRCVCVCLTVKLILQAMNAQ